MRVIEEEFVDTCGIQSRDSSSWYYQYVSLASCHNIIIVYNHTYIVVT